jgi:hypothetical protein
MLKVKNVEKCLKRAANFYFAGIMGNETNLVEEYC